MISATLLLTAHVKHICYHLKDGVNCVTNFQAAQLVRSGKEVLIVTSGAVGVGRQRLRKQALLRQSMSELISQKE